MCSKLYPMKQKIILLAIIALLITSCTSVEFETTVPKDTKVLAEFPKNLRGTYVNKENDALRIDRYVFEAGTKGTFGYIDGSLTSEELELKRFGNYYILNIIQSEYCIAIPFTHKNGKLSVYEIKFKDEIVENKIKSITQVKETKNKNGEIDNFIINPSNKELRKMFKEGVFSEIMVFNKVK